MILRCRDRRFDLQQRTLVMGIVNVTPDSFSDGGRHLEPGAAIAHARQLLAEGADLLDLGAESTRPGSEPVPDEEQIRRLTPVLEALAGTDAVLSVDTRSARVAAHALALGAHMVNDVSALADPAMARTVAASGAGLVLMHMRGTPATMQDDPRYADVTREVAAFLAERRAAAAAAGVADECIVLDPGIGFGKTPEHNLQLLGSVSWFTRLGRPVLVGASRKGFLGKLTGGAPAADRLEASLAAAVIAAWQGAGVLRVHDVAASRRALAVADAARAARPAG